MGEQVGGRVSGWVSWFGRVGVGGQADGRFSEWAGGSVSGRAGCRVFASFPLVLLKLPAMVGFLVGVLPFVSSL